MDASCRLGVDTAHRPGMSTQMRRTEQGVVDTERGVGVGACRRGR